MIKMQYFSFQLPCAFGGRCMKSPKEYFSSHQNIFALHFCIFFAWGAPPGWPKTSWHWCLHASDVPPLPRMSQSLLFPLSSALDQLSLLKSFANPEAGGGEASRQRWESHQSVAWSNCFSLRQRRASSGGPHGLASPFHPHNNTVRYFRERAAPPELSFMAKWGCEPSSYA